MRRHGADGPSYDTIVASGPAPRRPAAPPARPARDRGGRHGRHRRRRAGRRLPQRHDPHASSSASPPPSSSVCTTSCSPLQLAGVAAVRAGVAARDVDAVCRDIIADAGFGEWFMHGTGHGVGLLIHEDPFESPVSTTELRVGDVVTVEPGVYRGGFGGVPHRGPGRGHRTGCRILTSSPKDSPCLPSPPTT